MIQSFQDRLRFSGAVKRVFNLNNPDVRVVLRKLMKDTQFMRPTFVEGKPDLSAFREGQRDVVCTLLAHIHKDLDKLMEQIKHLENETTA